MYERAIQCRSISKALSRFKNPKLRHLFTLFHYWINEVEKVKRKIHKTFAHPLQLFFVCNIAQSFLFWLTSGSLEHRLSETNMFCFYFQDFHSLSLSLLLFLPGQNPEILSVSQRYVLRPFFGSFSRHVYARKTTVGTFKNVNSAHSTFLSAISCSSLIKQTHLFPMPFILSTLILIPLFFFLFYELFFRFCWCWVELRVTLFPPFFYPIFSSSLAQSFVHSVFPSEAASFVMFTDIDVLGMCIWEII